MEWYYHKNNQQMGPISSQELKQLAQTGELKPTDLVWKEGMDNWAPAQQVHTLFPQGAINTPPPSPPPRPIGVSDNAKQSHEIDYEIFGDDMQVVEVELDPQETVIAEAGAMNYMEDGITFEAKLGDGSKPDEGFFGKLWGGAKRMITGESLFMTHFTNSGTGKK
ncbi:MAG: DUF4339 domain-containing protein, partial [Planctomycetota bacterium]